MQQMLASNQHHQQMCLSQHARDYNNRTATEVSEMMMPLTEAQVKQSTNSCTDRNLNFNLKS